VLRVVIVLPFVWPLGVFPNPRWPCVWVCCGVCVSKESLMNHSSTPPISVPVTPHTGLAVDTTTDHGFEAELKAVEAQVAHVAGMWCVRRLRSLVGSYVSGGAFVWMCTSCVVGVSDVWDFPSYPPAP
jgi:hypothetical protein